MSSETYLIAVHIGPVQDFIASARRTRDLWFGSWLLSELSKAAAGEVVRRENGNLDCLVFPAPVGMEDLAADGNSEFSVANKVVARISGAPEDVARAVERAVRKRLRDLRDNTFERLEKRGAKILREVANAQVEDLLEFFWAACPLGGPGEYPHIRAQVEGMLAARKATRDFRPAEWGSHAPKSSLDGQRESVIPATEYAPPRTPLEQRKRIALVLRDRYGVREGERLCGIGLLKRLGQPGGEARFFSTSHVAALPLLARLTHEHHAAVDKYADTLCSLDITRRELGAVPRRHPVFGRMDGHVLFEERLRDYLEGDKLIAAKRALRGFRKAALDDLSPLPYYALLLADGDHMGKAIDGLPSPEQHRKLSLDLTDFAREVRGIVDEANGSLVYAGGDDVLAFVPLHTVVQCAQRLAATFSRKMADYRVTDGDRETTPTLSAGIAIAHHLGPLSDALELAREAEKKAKSLKGKSALAIIVSKRSGADYAVRGKWGELDERLVRFTSLHRRKQIPDGAGYELRDLALRLEVPPDCAEHKAIQEVTHHEALRILGRKHEPGGGAKVADQVLQDLECLLKSGEMHVPQLANELIVARLFAEAGDQAEPDLQGPSAEEGE